jgi:hypothetical protein
MSGAFFNRVTRDVLIFYPNSLLPMFLTNKLLGVIKHTSTPKQIESLLLYRHVIQSAPVNLLLAAQNH